MKDIKIFELSKNARTNIEMIHCRLLRFYAVKEFMRLTGFKYYLTTYALNERFRKSGNHPMDKLDFFVRDNLDWCLKGFYKNKRAIGKDKWQKGMNSLSKKLQKRAWSKV